jgi:DNA invertase Pin-like site-specific DNA recombinase
MKTRRQDKGVGRPSDGPLKVTIWATGKTKRQRDADLRKLRTHARRRGWRVTAEYSDVGGSAVGLAALLRDFHRGEIRNVLVGHLTDLPLTSLSIAARLLSLADYGAVNVCDTMDDTSLASKIGRSATLCAIWVAAEAVEERLASLTGERSVSAALQAGPIPQKTRRPRSSRADPSPRLAKRGRTKPPRRSGSTVGVGRVIVCTERHHLVGAARPAK